MKYTMNHYLTPDSHKYQYYYDEKVNTCLLYVTRYLVIVGSSGYASEHSIC